MVAGCQWGAVVGGGGEMGHCRMGGTGCRCKVECMIFIMFIHYDLIRELVVAWVGGRRWWCVCVCVCGGKGGKGVGDAVQEW